MCNVSDCPRCKWNVLGGDSVEVTDYAVRYRVVLYDVNGCVLVQSTWNSALGFGEY